MRHQVETERKAERPGQDVKPMGWGRERERRQTGRGTFRKRYTRAHTQEWGAETNRNLKK